MRYAHSGLKAKADRGLNSVSKDRLQHVLKFLFLCILHALVSLLPTYLSLISPDLFAKYNLGGTPSNLGSLDSLLLSYSKF